MIKHVVLFKLKEATQEAVLNSLCAAQDAVALDGTVVEGLGKYL